MSVPVHYAAYSDVRELPGYISAPCGHGGALATGPGIAGRPYAFWELKDGTYMTLERSAVTCGYCWRYATDRPLYPGPVQ
jgi:hypothetical protein